MSASDSHVVDSDPDTYEHLQHFADRLDYDVDLSDVVRALIAEAVENSMVGDRVVARLNLVHRHRASS
jgi:hypothetical protein